MKSKTGQRAVLILLLAYCVDLILKLVDWSDFARLPIWGLILALTFRFAFMGFLLYLYLQLRKPRSEPTTINARKSPLRLLRTIHAVMLAAVALYIVIAERSAGPTSGFRPSIALSFGILAAIVAMIAFGFRRKMLPSAIEGLQQNPQDTQSLVRWQQAHILTMVLMTSVALFGFSLRFMGGSFWVAFPFYVVSVGLLLHWRPREVAVTHNGAAPNALGS